jgi:hypothetical protein
MVNQPEQHETVEEELERLRRTEQGILSVQRKALRAQDLTNLLMVAATLLMAVATAFSALSSWRMARVTAGIFLASDRPYLGVESVDLDLSNAAEPTSWIKFKNFGSVPADRSVIDVSSSIDGHPVLGGAAFAGLGTQHVVMSLGVLTPQTEYRFGALFPPQFAKPVADGKSRIIVSVGASYRDTSGQHFCYAMDYIYYWPLKKYDPAGGSNKCADDAPVYSDDTTLSHLMSADRH